MTPEDYIALVADRLRESGAHVQTVPVKGETALVGYRGQFRLRWMATKLHLFTVVRSVPVVRVEELEQFAKDSLSYASEHKGAFRGLQSGVAAIPVLVGGTVAPDAATFATNKLVRRFSAFAWPAAVDLSQQKTFQHQGRVAIGGIYAGYLREQSAIALPEPTA